MESSEDKPKEKQQLTARILSPSDLTSMIANSQKGLPIRVPAAIKVVTTNVTQSPSSNLPGLIVAKPSNLIIKGKAFVIEQPNKDFTAKVPNILQRGSPSKNTIDRQVVSHEATIELKKNKLKMLHVDLLKPLTTIEGTHEDEIMDLAEMSMKCEKNELGAIELKGSHSSKLDESEDLDLDLTCSESVEGSPPKAKDTNAKAEAKVKDDDEILCCGGCGCYGMAGEFFTNDACSSTCQSRIVAKCRDKAKKERELVIQKQRREQRKRELAMAKESKAKLLESNEESNEENEEELPFDSPHPWLDVKRGFSWSRYLECTNSRSAPTKLFAEGYPSCLENPFKVGQKLEAIDPEHPALICVASIAQVQGHRLLIHFDGFSKAHDFWENSYSPNLFPVNWCEAHRQKLMPPPGWDLFSWPSYLESTRGQAAPKENFKANNKPLELNGWKVGQKLEAVDKSNTSLICVATVTNVMDGRVLVHFDGWDLDYDYWVTPSSPYIHPKGWCSEKGLILNKPKGYRGEFTWDKYLDETRSKPVPNWAFKQSKQPEMTQFKRGMKLEVVDKWNPIFVRVATVTDVMNHQIKVHFDGWPLDTYDFWIEDDSLDLHPIMWCAKTGHALMPPLTIEEVSYYMAKNGCPTPGCRGLGHAKGYENPSHDRLADCPYSPQNLNNDSIIPDRLNSIRGHKRTQSTDSDMPSKLDSDDDPELGRGNRKRKKRKFFDEKEDFSDLLSNGATSSTPKRLNDYHQSNNGYVIRQDVFSPDHIHSDFMWDVNASFLKDSVNALNSNLVRKWGACQVAAFLANLPIKSDKERLKAKVINEEIDGEALLLMTQNDFVNLLGLKLGPAIKVFNALLLIKKSKY